MAKITHAPTPEINRLRAAAALIPIIEAGLIDSKISTKRASPMVTFCEWTIEHVSDDPCAVKLAQMVETDLKRVKTTFVAGKVAQK